MVGYVCFGTPSAPKSVQNNMRCRMTADGCDTEIGSFLVLPMTNTLKNRTNSTYNIDQVTVLHPVRYQLQVRPH